jgi:hypothetical protein
MGKRAVLTNDVQAADRGRQRNFGSAQRSGVVIVGYWREGEGGVTPLLGLSDSVVTYMEVIGA